MDEQLNRETPHLSEADKAYRKALVLLRRKEFEVALSYMDDACHAEPDRLLYRAWRAYTAHLCGLCTEGSVLRLVHTYTLMESKDTPQLMLLLGHIRRRTGKVEKARYWYEKAAELAPEDQYIQRALKELDPGEPPVVETASVETPAPPGGLWQAVRSWLRV